MISVSEAEAIIAERVPRLGSESVSLIAAVGRVLHQVVVADRDQPPFDRATMDGIAIDSAAGHDPRVVSGVQAAGQAPLNLDAADQCIEIMTGAMLPSGADCVVPVEQLSIDSGFATLAAEARIRPWQFVHRKGTDYEQGRPLLEPGSRLGPAEIAVLASVGCAKVQVNRWPTVTVVSTGDELRAAGEDVAPFQIRRCNDYAIAAALRSLGLADVTTLHIRDDAAALERGIGAALDEGRWLILTGGVSKGKFDYLPGVFEQLGVDRHFHRIAQRPGKPMWFGSREQAPVFALPGNPVSALVCLHRYVLPAMVRAAGGRGRPPSIALDYDVARRGDLTHFVPVEEDLSGTTTRRLPRELNTSGDFFGLAGTIGLVELGRDRDHFPAGTNLPFYPWQR